MSARLVRELRVEATAQTQQLDAALQASAQKVDAFKKTAEGAAAAGGQLGNRFGTAATQIASASENIARTGQVTGDALKQIGIQGAQMATLFGPQGAIVGAIAVSAIAIAGLFTRIKREAQEAAEASEAQFARIRALSSSTSAAAEANRLSQGSPGANRAQAGRRGGGVLTSFQGIEDKEAFADAFGLAGVREEIERVEEALAKAQARGTQGVGLARAIEGELKGLREVESTRTRALDAAIERTKELVATETRGRELTAEQTAKAQAATKQLADLERQRLKTVEDLRKKEEQAQQARAKASEQLTDVITKIKNELAGITVTPLEEAVAGLREKASELSAIDQERLKQAEALLQQLLAQRDAKKAQADLSKAQLDYDKRVAEETVKANQAIERGLEAERQRAEAQQQAVRDAQAFAFQIQQAVGGVLQLAEAFGAVNASTVAVLRNISQVASNVDPLIKAISAGDTAAILSGGLGIIGGIAGIVSSITSANREQKEAALALLDAQAQLLRNLDERIAAFGQTDFEAEIARLTSNRDATRAQLGDNLRSQGVRLNDAALQLPVEELQALALFTAQLGGLSREQIKAIEGFINGVRKAEEELEAAVAAAEANRQRNRQLFDEDLEIRRAELAGDSDRAAQIRLRRQQEEEEAALRAAGIFSKEEEIKKLEELRALQAEEFAALIADQKKRREEEEAREQERIQREQEARDRRESDAQTRVDVARAGSPDEAAAIRRQAQYARELAEETDPAIQALIQFAQVLEEAAIAAELERQAKERSEDLEVRLLRAKGQNEQADRLAFKFRQEREYAAAVAAGWTAEQLAELSEVLGAELEAFEFSFQQAASSIGESAERSASRTVGAISSFTGATLEQTDRLLGLLTTANALSVERNRLLAAMAGTTVRAPATSTLSASNVAVSFSGPINVTVSSALGSGAESTGRAIADAVVRQIEQRLARNLLDARRRGGDNAL